MWTLVRGDGDQCKNADLGLLRVTAPQTDGRLGAHSVLGEVTQKPSSKAKKALSQNGYGGELLGYIWELPNDIWERLGDIWELRGDISELLADIWELLGAVC